MALKNVRPNAGGGGKNGSRWVHREEAKDGARQIRRNDDGAAVRTRFDEYLAEQLKDPEFRAAYEAARAALVARRGRR